MNYLIYTPKKIKHYYFQFIDCLMSTFKKLNIKSKCIDNFYNTSHHNTTIIILADPRWIIKNHYIHKIRRISYKTPIILYETEPIDFYDKILYNRYKPSSIWTYCQSNYEILKTGSIPIKLIYPGYHSIYNYFDNNTDINIIKKPFCIIGADYQNRISKITNYDKLSIERCTVWNHKDWNQLISNGAFLFINVHKKNTNCIEMFRLAPLLSSGAIIISEHCNPVDEAFLKDLVIFCSPDNFENIIQEYFNKSTEEIQNQRLMIIKIFNKNHNIITLMKNLISLN